MTELIVSLVKALVMTVLLESIAIIYFKPRKRVLLAGLLGNILTNPLVNLVAITVGIKWGGTVYVIAVLCCELLAIIVEAKVYRVLTGLTVRRCFMISIIANCLSYFIGLMLYGL